MKNNLNAAVDGIAQALRAYHHVTDSEALRELIRQRLQSDETLPSPVNLLEGYEQLILSWAKHLAPIAEASNLPKQSNLF
jgi:hypothetical protein